jgi:hypothetical protein
MPVPWLIIFYRKREQTGEIKMTKYLVFRNQPDSGQTNVPGSREEMACTIAEVVSQDALPKDFYIAYPLENPNSNWDQLKETAMFSVEIDDERAEQWEKEISPLTDLAQAIDDAIGEAYSAIVEAARAFDHACEKSVYFKDIKALENIGMDRAFDNLENGSPYEVAAKVEEVFEVETFHHHHA